MLGPLFENLCSRIERFNYGDLAWSVFVALLFGLGALAIGRIMGAL